MQSHVRLTGILLGASMLASTSALAAGQVEIPSYSDARDVFWDDLYPGSFVELYCGKSIAAQGEHNIEHVFPAFWMTKAVGCGSRKQCRRSSDDFNFMEADLHNLYPTRTRVNTARGSFPFGEIAGEDHDFPGCDFEEERGIVEPREASRGEIARAVLHVAEAYDAADAVPAGQLELMHEWDRLDPPDVAERARNDRIEELQGTRNAFIDAHDSTVADAEETGGSGTEEDEVDGVRVRIATWNIENLHSVVGEPMPDRRGAPARSQADYDRIARYIAAVDADIFAFQEVNGPAAAHLVFPENEYQVVVSDRFDEDEASGGETDHIYTGIAVKKDGNVTFIASQTYRELGIDHVEDGESRPTRRGTEVLVELPNGEPLQVMSVHLKSGCHNGSLENPSRPACLTLAAQRAPLESWIDDLTEDDTPFVIAGDWNRRLDRFGPNDHIWQEIDDGEPVPLDLVRFPEGITSPCLIGTSGHFPEPIDFLVLDEQAAKWVHVNSFQIVDFDEGDKPERDLISDHCPAFVDLVMLNE